MLVAIPTFNKKIVSKRIGRMTEITFIEVLDNTISKQFFEPVSLHHEYEEKLEYSQSHAHHNQDGKHQNRHQEIKEKLCKADILFYKSMCKNWRERLKDCEIKLKRTNNDLLLEVFQEIETLNI
jgi:hypothetical protein